MDQKSTRELRLDRRLIRRRGWISRSELDAELSELPDVTEKIADPEPEEERPTPGEPQPG